MAREYEIARSSGCCRVCGRRIEGGEEFVVALLDAGLQFERHDFCLACWQAGPPAAQSAFSVWRSRQPLPSEPKKTFVDDEVLVDFFNRLADQDEPAKISFRFVLALMLMRKKVLIYDGKQDAPDAGETWQMHFRGRGQPVQVIHPPLDEEKIAEVTSQLGSLFEVQP